MSTASPGLSSATTPSGAPPSRDLDAVVVGAGPNGLTAAVTLARAGRSVHVVEAREDIGGGARSADLFGAGVTHDICSAVHPMGAASPVFRRLPLERHGLRWVHPPVPVAHPLDGGRAGVQRRSLEETAEWLGADGPAWRRLFGPAVRAFDDVMAHLADPVRLPRRPLALAAFGAASVLPARRLAERVFSTPEAQGLFIGMAAHAIRPLDAWTTAAFGMLLGVMGHTVGWPVAQGGSQAIVDALAGHLRELGGTIETGRHVRELGELPPARAVLFDTSAQQLAAIAGDALPGRYRDALGRHPRGAGVVKVDYLLDGPAPWAAAGCDGAGTLHLGGTLEEIAASEAAIVSGRVSEAPYVLIAQQSRVDATRTSGGHEALWAYTHVPNGYPGDPTEAITRQVERFAPGFRDRVLGVRTWGTAELERYNPTYAGGDISAGALDPLSLLARPTARVPTHTTPNPRLYLCSAATLPGPGVHGLCGYHGARAALRRALR